MKHILFFLALGVLVWIAIVPPDGMNKYPAVNVRFEYSQEKGTAKISVEKAPHASQQESSPDGGDSASDS